MPRIPKGPPKGQPPIDLAQIKAVDADLDALDELLPESRRRKKGSEPPEPRSQLAIRADGKLLVSIEDSEGCDLRGREIATFIVLDDDEECLVHTVIDDPLCEAAARVIGRLPRRKP